MAALPRETWKWLQSLGLSVQVRNVRRDFANGFLVAEIFARYHPDEVPLHSFVNGHSLQCKTSNWRNLEKVFTARRVRNAGADGPSLRIPRGLTESTMHCKPGAAATLVTIVYEFLTNRPAKDHHEEETARFDDLAYQASLPSYARATASQAIKNNLPLETVADDLHATARRANSIIDTQQRLKKMHKDTEPDRYGIDPRGPTGHGTIRGSLKGTSRQVAWDNAM